MNICESTKNSVWDEISFYHSLNLFSSHNPRSELSKEVLHGPVAQITAELKADQVY